MNPLTDIVFSLTWVLLFVWAIRTMSKGWNQKLNNTSGMWTTKVKRPMHPEMMDVKPGEELKQELEDDDDDNDGDVPSILKR